MRPLAASVTPRRATQVLDVRLADESALADRSERVAFQLDGREGGGALGQVRERGLPAGGIGQGATMLAA